MIKNDLKVPRISSRMIARIAYLQQKKNHHHRAKTLPPRQIPFWASAKTISIKDICGGSLIDPNEDKENIDQEVIAKNPVLNDWDKSKKKTDYCKREEDNYISELQIGCQKLVPEKIHYQQRAPLLNSKYIVPDLKAFNIHAGHLSDSKSIATDTKAYKIWKEKKASIKISKSYKHENEGFKVFIKKEESDSTLKDLEAYLEQGSISIFPDEVFFQENIEEMIDIDSSALRHDFLGKRCINLIRVYNRLLLIIFV
jgi:hypothetical protein